MKKRTFEEILANLNEEQKLLLADVIRFGYFGDAQFNTPDGGYVYCDVYITDDAYQGNHFERKSIPNRLKNLYKALNLEGTKHNKTDGSQIFFSYDWWGDGSGSVLAFVCDLGEEIKTWVINYK